MARSGGRMGDAQDDSSRDSKAAQGESDSASRDRGFDPRTAHLWHLQPVRDILVIGIVAGTVYAGYAMRTVTVPLLVALALAYLVEPVVARMTRWRGFSRPVAVTTILAALGTILAVLLAIVIPIAVGQTLSFASGLRGGRYDPALVRLVETLPTEYQGDARTFLDRFLHPLKGGDLKGGDLKGGDAPLGAGVEGAPPETAVGRDEVQPAEDGSSEPPATPPVPSDSAEAGAERAAAPPETGAVEPRPGTVGDAIAQLPESMRRASGDNPLLALLGAGSKQVYAFALTVLQISLVAFLIPFYFFYFSVYWPDITGFFSKLIPDERRDSILGLIGEMDRAVAGFVRGRIVICMLMGVMFAIGWQFCGVPYGIALGLLTGALSIVPYLGGVGLPFAVILLVVDQFGLPPEARMAVWGMLLWPTVVFAVVQTIEGYLLTPVIAGKATNLDPVTIVVAILAGGSVAGVYGMLLAIPIAACGKIVLRRLVLPRLVEFARGRVADPLPIDAAIDEPSDASQDARKGER
ncbi:MAG: AI-2E family transporter [Phycisphaera sp.]|nr:AI-2E family transporter [Phycisphaera sp.]